MFKRLFLLYFFTIVLSMIGLSQSYNPFFGSIVSNYNSDTILNYLTHFENLGVKEIGTSELQNTQDWIVSKYNEFGYNNITLQSFTYSGQSTANVVVKKEGCVFPDKYVIVDGHYDTKNGPGTNDNGSGTSIILEMARVLKDVQTKYSILFIHFSGEEDGLKGSIDYVNNVVIPTNMDIKVVFNIDEVGGVAGMTNNTIVCERDEHNPPGNNTASAIITDELATCVGLYSNLLTEIDFAYSSDYMPFEDNGEIITGFFEKNQSAYAHTPMDVLINTDPVYIHEVGKAACGATMHFAEAFNTTTISAFTCDTYTSPSGNYVWTDSDVYYDTLTTAAGCDSIIEIVLINNSFDAFISFNADSLYTNIQDATSYQWYDCDQEQNITGATGSSFIPGNLAGEYAVIVSDNGCIDTTSCFLHEPWGLIDFPSEALSIYPNPGDRYFQFELTELPGEKTIKIYDLTGKIVLEKTFNTESITLDLQDLPKGKYPVVVHHGTLEKSFHSVLIKQ